MPGLMACVYRLKGMQQTNNCAFPRLRLSQPGSILCRRGETISGTFPFPHHSALFFITLSNKTDYCHTFLPQLDIC